ncbi:MAG: hypothetical protein LBT25_03940 [Candidatus Symbiothrix sp.]|jgi:hypothetical protein|nr:hypothetical protein [Candidatus Symbiothrix sp.]
MKKYLILVFTVLFFSCVEKQKTPIESINVLYYNYIFEPMISVTCDEIVYRSPKNDTIYIEGDEYWIDDGGILDTIITDKKVLEGIENELKKTKKRKDYGIDARMKCYINFKDGNIDTICIDSSPVCGYYNGKSMQFTNKFAYLIRKNCGFYEWFVPEMLQYFDELNDTTYVREKIKTRWGDEY